MLTNAFSSISENQKTYTFGEITPMIVGPGDVLENVGEFLGENIHYHTCRNTGDTDFCSQINLAAKNVTTDYFSILEFDDLYADNWFKMAHDYFYTNESVSLFLPINILTDSEHKEYHFINEIAWTSAFSDDIGYLDFDCLQDYSMFNLTGGIFNTKDFITIGGFKPSMKISFNYELLLRMAKKELKIFVVPKEGYMHVVGRNDSLSEEYNSLSIQDIKKWYDLAKTEYMYTEDRKTNIDKIKEEDLK